MQARLHGRGPRKRHRLRIRAGVLPTGDQLSGLRLHRGREPYPTGQLPPDGGPTLGPPRLARRVRSSCTGWYAKTARNRCARIRCGFACQIGRSPISLFRLRKVASTSVNRQYVRTVRSRSQSV